MSVLSYICKYGYSSSSEDSDGNNENEKNVKKKSKPRLPVPDLSKVKTIPAENHIDKPYLHGGRIRSFPHERGNWATFVYIKYSDENALHSLINNLQREVLDFNIPCEIIEDLHISISRTVTLKYHQINPFTKSLKDVLADIGSIDLSFESIQIYCNEEKTRTFVALNVDYSIGKQLLRISKKVDEVLADFNLPTFYCEPSFHMSVLWINGDKETELQNILNKLNNILNQDVGRTIEPLCVTELDCKIGNKHFKYSLH